MHPTISHYLTHARLADARHRPKSDRVRRRPSPRTVLAIAPVGSAVAQKLEGNA